jgi:hypothetical protein
MTAAEVCEQQFRDPARAWLIALLIESAVKHELPPSLVLAVASRETNVRNMLGDHGYGHGPMQLDSRSHKIPEDWREHPAGIIDACCQLLVDYIGWAKRTYPALKDDAVRVGIAAYNAGPAGAAHGVKVGRVDSATTGGNYSADVLARETIFARLLKEAGEKK